MKKLLIAGLMVGVLAACSVRADENGGGKALTPKQQRLRNSLIQKYDLNQDGVLDKNEAKKLSKADKKALAKTGGIDSARKGIKTSKGEAVKDTTKSKGTAEK